MANACLSCAMCLDGRWTMFPWGPSQVRVPPQLLVASGNVIPPPGEDQKMDPKQQGGAPGTHAKFWRLGRALHRVPMSVSSLVTEILPPKEWVYAPLQPLFWPQACRRKFNHLPPNARSVMGPIGGTQAQLSNGYSNALLAAVVGELCEFKI